MIHLVDVTFFEGWTAWSMPCHALFGRTWKIYVCFWLRISIYIAVIIGSIDYRIQSVVELYLWYLCPDNNITATKSTAIMYNCLWYHATGYIISWHLQNNGIIYTGIQSTVRVMEEVWKLDVQHNISYKIQKRFLLFCFVLRWLYKTQWESCNLFAHVVGCVTAIGQFYDDHLGTREVIPFIWPNLPVHNNRSHFDTLQTKQYSCDMLLHLAYYVIYFSNYIIFGELWCWEYGMLSKQIFWLVINASVFLFIRINYFS